jgi:hypothetical protein
MRTVRHLGSALAREARGLFALALWLLALPFAALALAGFMAATGLWLLAYFADPDSEG